MHAPPVLAQHRVALPTVAQVRPPAQHAASPTVHAAASPRAHAGARQVPEVQVSPEQQSALVEHVCALVRHAQCPAVQIIWPQQPALVVHSAAASEQQMEDVGDALHESPVQHDAAAVHAPAATVHVGVARAQRPEVQVRPPLHSVPVAQHA